MNEELFDGFDDLRKTLQDAQEILAKLRNVTLQEDSSEFRQLKAQNQRMKEALEKLYSIIEHKRPAWTNEEMRWIRETKEVLEEVKE